jgi:hypothetical protein
MAIRTSIAHSFRKASSLKAIDAFMALQATAASAKGSIRVRWAVRIMARRAGQRIALFKTSTLTKVADLIGDMIFLGMPCLKRLEELFERPARDIGERPPARFDRVAVALGTNIDLPIP